MTLIEILDALLEDMPVAPPVHHTLRDMRDGFAKARDWAFEQILSGNVTDAEAEAIVGQLCEMTIKTAELTTTILREHSGGTA